MVLFFFNKPSLWKLHNPNSNKLGIDSFSDLLKGAALKPLPILVQFSKDEGQFLETFYYTTDPSNPSATELSVTFQKGLLSYEEIRMERTFFSELFLPIGESIVKEGFSEIGEPPCSIVNKYPFQDAIFIFLTEAVGKKITTYFFLKTFKNYRKFFHKPKHHAKIDILANTLLQLYPYLNEVSVTDFNTSELDLEVDNLIVKDHGRSFFHDLLYSCDINPKDWCIRS